MMKQAIQLEIPFDGQALTAAPAVAGSSQVKSIPTDAAELRVLAAVRRSAGTALSALPSLKLAAQAVACVAFGFGLMFLSAIIGG